MARITSQEGEQVQVQPEQAILVKTKDEDEEEDEDKDKNNNEEDEDDGEEDDNKENSQGQVPQHQRLVEELKRDWAERGLVKNVVTQSEGLDVLACLYLEVYNWLSPSQPVHAKPWDCLCMMGILPAWQFTDVLSLPISRGLPLVVSLIVGACKPMGLLVHDGNSACLAVSIAEVGLSLRKCSLQFGMSRSAITNWEEGRTQNKKKGPPSMLSMEEEDALLQWVFLKCEYRHGVSVHDVKLKFAEMCQTRHTLLSNGIPGKSWWEAFRRRHPNLVFRVSEGLDQSRTCKFRPEIVKTLHDNLEKLYSEHNFPPTNIWNADETGFQGSRDKGMKVLARKGAKAVYGITADSREWMTVLCCVNAARHAIPSYYIFKGHRITCNYIQYCEPGAAMAMQKKAWMTGELFHAWLVHFDNAITLSIRKSSRHLLILDGHGNHVSMNVIAKAQDFGIDIITLPAHTSHKLQPLDDSVFKSLKVQFWKERDIWQQRTSSCQATKTELATIVAKAIESSVTESNIKAGLRTTRIWPLDATAIRFEGMSSNHITLHEDPCTTTNRENFSNEEEYPSQVASTPLNQTSEDEVILALKNLVAQFDADIMRVHGELDFTSMIEQGKVEPLMTFAQLLKEGDITNYQGASHEIFYNTDEMHAVNTDFSWSNSQLENRVGDENRNPNHTHQSRQHEQSKTIDLLKVPTSEVCITQVNREAFVDYTNNLILTSTQYMDSMRAKTAKKEELAKAKETKRLDKEKKRAQFLAEKETVRQKRLDAQQARQSRKAWEIQQKAFEARLRSVLWEGGSMQGLYLRPLHVDQPYHAMARKQRAIKLHHQRQQQSSS
ncbi:hypothetical protein L7F22_005493 [Adiantum nelumboides]|nr:hypothetical protein [Adiantum nelumboides]